MRGALLILSGYNIRAVVALCRWATAAGVPFHLVARNAADPILLTAYREQVFAMREDAALTVSAFAQWIGALRAVHGYERVVLVPSTEYLNRFLLTERSALDAAGGVLPLVDAALYATLSDKQAFSDCCRSHGIAVPARHADVPSTVPFVAKPVHYGAATSGQIKPYLVRTAEDRARFLAREDVARFYCEEWVEGESLYLLLHRSRDGRVTMTSQQNLLQQGAGGSIVLARASTVHELPAVSAYLTLLEDLGFHGLLMIEVRLEPGTGRLVMIEANPRPWGPIQFTLDRHVDLFTPWLSDAGLTIAPPTPEEPPRPFYFWSGGLQASARPYAWHDYAAGAFVDEYHAIVACDLFARPDTMRLYTHELAA